MDRPTKLYYKIGEACKALDIQPYVLRYWETEFPSLSPTKSKSGQRVYTDREIEVIRRIKQLLYDEGYTIAGAKKKLETELAELMAPAPDGTGADAAPVPAARKTRTKTQAAAAQNLALPLARPAVGRRSQAWRDSAERALRDAREILDLLDRPKRRP